MESLTDWFNQLLLTNERVKNERVGMMPYLAVPTPVVELIFLICNLLDQPEEVRYLSVELFDRFIRLHFKDLMTKVWEKDRGSAHEQWKTVEKKLHTQTSLRMLTCIQLASKFTIHPKIVRAKDIQTYLKAEGKSYTLRMILSSEIRVWKTLNFVLNFPTVLTHVDLILEQLKSFFNLPAPFKEIYEIALLLTDVVYLHHQEIYHNLFYLSTGRWEATQKEKQEFLPTECNILYRAASVVALAMTFTTSGSEDERIYEEIGSLTHLPPFDIRALAVTINKIVF